MNFKKTLVLAVVLGIATLYLTKVMIPQREKEAGEKMAFAKLTSAEINSIDVVQSPTGGGGEQRYTLKREQEAADEKAAIAQSASEKKSEGGDGEDKGRWSLQSVRGALIDTAAMTSFVGGLRDLAVEGPLDERDRYTDLAAYGLSKPELTTVVHERGGRDTEIAFGKKNQYLSKRYVKISGRSGIFLADETAFEQLNKSSSDLRSKTPFRFNSSDVRTLRLTSSQGQFELQQTSVGEWKITDPAEYRASNEDVEALLQAIHNVTVSEFIDGQQAQRSAYGFDTPRLNIVIKFREGIAPSSAEFFLANANMVARSAAQKQAEPVLYFAASNSDTIFKLASDPSPALIKRLDDLRFKQIVEVAATSIDKVVATPSDGAVVTIAASGTTWTVNGKQSDPIFVDQILRDIAGLKAVRFPETVPPDAFEKPFVVLAITSKEGDKPTSTVTVGKEFTAESGDVLRYVRNSAHNVVYGIRDVEAKRIVPHEEALVQVTPAPAEPTAKAM